MAERKVIVFICDRCGTEHKRLRGKTLPKDWLMVLGKDLCPGCTQALNKFFEGVDINAPHLIEESVNAAPIEEPEGVISRDAAMDNLGIEEPEGPNYSVDFGASRFA